MVTVGPAMLLARTGNFTLKVQPERRLQCRIIRYSSVRLCKNWPKVTMVAQVDHVLLCTKTAAVVQLALGL